MKILALEFSSADRSVAVLQEGSTSVNPLCLQEIESGSGQTFHLIEKLLGKASIPREEIEMIAVGLGPGSYGGIRSAIALAQGWQLGRDVKLVGVSSAECIAAQAAADGVTGSVVVTVDAHRGEFYLANYELTASFWRETQGLRLATKQAVLDCQAKGDLAIGPEVDTVFQNAREVWPRAALLARLASERKDFVPGQDLKPLYLRETSFVKAPPSRLVPE
jgi:tRNA threonylcarbamoyl adenosine modification protein YeaZ